MDAISPLPHRNILERITDITKSLNNMRGIPISTSYGHGVFKECDYSYAVILELLYINPNSVKVRAINKLLPIYENKAGLEIYSGIQPLSTDIIRQKLLDWGSLWTLAKSEDYYDFDIPDEMILFVRPMINTYDMIIINNMSSTLGYYSKSGCFCDLELNRDNHSSYLWIEKFMIADFNRDMLFSLPIPE